MYFLLFLLDIYYRFLIIELNLNASITDYNCNWTLFISDFRFSLKKGGLLLIGPNFQHMLVFLISTWIILNIKLEIIIKYTYLNTFKRISKNHHNLFNHIYQKIEIHPVHQQTLNLPFHYISLKFHNCIQKQYMYLSKPKKK